MSVIAWDPSYAKPVAYAYRVPGAGWKAADLPASAVWRGGLTRVFEAAKFHGVEYCVIEHAYLAQNVKVTMGLSEVRGALRAWAGTVGMKVRLVRAVEWKQVLVRSGRAPKGRAAQKKAAREVAALEVGCTLNEDQSEAVCMVLWAEAMLRQHRLDAA
jgi:Holliday junction resolvasome RuvABC endonuclease subunit